MMTTDSGSPLTASLLTSLIQTSDAIAIAVRLAGNNVIHAGQVGHVALDELDHLLITNWNHLDMIEPPFHMISELGGKAVIIHSSFVNEKNLVFLAFDMSTPYDIVDFHTDLIVTKLKTYDLRSVLQTEKEKAEISDWFREDDKKSQELVGEDEITEDESPTIFGSSTDPVISQTHAVDNPSEIKDPDLSEIPLADVISLINEDERTSIPLENRKSNSADDSEWQILENMTQNKVESDPLEIHTILPSDNINVDNPEINLHSGWQKQIDDVSIVSPAFEENDPITQAHEPGQIDSTFFYLVPGLNYHYLIGDLSQRLRQWVPDICKIYGWKLGILSVRPDYLRWSLEGFPESSIPGMLKILREETSKHIYTEFPGLKTKIEHEDYWSSSYLIDRDDQHFSTQALILMISKDRLSR